MRTRHEFSLSLSALYFWQATVCLEPPVPIPISNPRFCILLHPGRGRLELTCVNVHTRPTTNVSVSSNRGLAGEANATHQASLRTTLNLARLIKCFAFSLYSARFPLRCAFLS
ncbi:hypothetical protein M3J09_008018 [Ascochyta lentis]